MTPFLVPSGICDHRGPVYSMGARWAAHARQRRLDAEFNAAPERRCWPIPNPTLTEAR